MLFSRSVPLVVTSKSSLALRLMVILKLSVTQPRDYAFPERFSIAIFSDVACLLSLLIYTVPISATWLGAYEWLDADGGGATTEGAGADSWGVGMLS